MFITVHKGMIGYQRVAEAGALLLFCGIEFLPAKIRNTPSSALSNSLISLISALPPVSSMRS